ncbi:MAG TPA: CUAEP/CCAEP-tail radical SAM protein, partial [Ktedonobacterales bacterium]|nr:CUAEP/CCAEP-tail radical SAM protein [Ktedonobacterales bacterium]
HDLIDNIDPVQYSIRLLVPPGSALLGADDVSDWLGPLDQAAFSYHWLHPDARMDALQRAVAALVEATARQSPAPSADATFAAIRALAGHMLGRSGATPAEAPSVMERLMALAPRTKGALPHLTESWFC